MWLLRLLPLCLWSALAKGQFDDTVALVIGGSLTAGVGGGLDSVELMGCTTTTDVNDNEVIEAFKFSLKY